MQTDSSHRVLILGGTKDARLIAEVLVAQGLDVTSSLAGVTERPEIPAGKLRSGGFGGAQGLRRYLQEESITVLIDATHPFAAVMSRHAAEAAKGLPLRHLRLERPAWQQQPGDHWITVPTVEAAAKAIPQGARVFLAIGRKHIAPFFARSDVFGIARMIEKPDEPVPPNWTLLQSRPDENIDAEIALLRHHAITCVVAKNAGGTSAQAKIDASRTLSLPVIMLTRPEKTGGLVLRSGDEIVNEIRSGRNQSQISEHIRK
jgi:precorrin-6A/cobalt-precorrin-6A reductase